MDKTVRGKSRRPTRDNTGQVVVLAGWYQFGSGERAERPCVESRMLLWCDAGRGRLCINGAESEFLPGDWVLLPWRHSIVYQADSKTPFLTGGIHIIPHHDGRAVMFRVAHRNDDPLAGHASRRDVRWPGLDGVVRRRFSGDNDPLAMLARYVVERFQQASPQRALMAQLASILIQELTLAAQCQTGHSGLLPTAALRRLQGYAETHIGEQLSIDDLAASAGCSEASVYRWFRQHAHTSPGKWLARLRTERAATLLRTTTLSVREIGERVGFTDPFHFSRVFKRERGLSPRTFRARQLIL